MAIDYLEADRVFELSFAKLDKRTAKLDFPKLGTLSGRLTTILSGPQPAAAVLPHEHFSMLATAGVEMWHRAIHSFICSVAMTEDSPLWASISGYYSSHFVMRAFAHSLGIFKSFSQRTSVQVVVQGKQFVCSELADKGGEHAFYWKAVKGHSYLLSNPLFRENHEREIANREDKSDVVHRNFANYADHLDSFRTPKLSSIEAISERIDKISRIRRHSITAPTPQRDRFPDIGNVQILAFQRIVAFHDFLDARVANNRFWRAHRRPSWCKDIMLYQVEDRGMEQPETT
jgi:hypothetical protein